MDNSPKDCTATLINACENSIDSTRLDCGVQDISESNS